MEGHKYLVTVYYFRMTAAESRGIFNDIRTYYNGSDIDHTKSPLNKLEMRKEALALSHQREDFIHE
jgi:hypothetical protein